jgi:hypothetical protein
VASCGHAGSERRHEDKRRAHVAREHSVERRDFELRGRSEEGDPRVVDDVADVADVVGEALNIRGVAQVGSDEARLAAGGGDLLDRFGAASSVTAVNDDVCAGAGPAGVRPRARCPTSRP